MGLHLADWLHRRLLSGVSHPNLTWQIALFLLCTILFLTSNIIRMISWIPFLGRNGIANSTLISMGVIDEPLEWLLFSDFSVILAFVHLYTLFMVVPIFITMMRIDKILDRSIGGCRCHWLADALACDHSIDQTGDYDRYDICGRPGHGRFHHRTFYERLQSANMGRLIQNDIALLQYPSASLDRCDPAHHRPHSDWYASAFCRYTEGTLNMEPRPSLFFYYLSAFFVLFIVFFMARH